MDNLSPEFERVLEGYRLDDLEQHRGAIYGLWKDFRLAYLNSAWINFARDNGADSAFFDKWRLGAHILDAVPDQLRPLYQEAYSTCLSTGEPWHHEYECSSPTDYRRFHQIVYPLHAAAVLVVNSLKVESPHDENTHVPRDPDERMYRDPDGFVHQCAYCRRVENQLERRRWDWVPAWVQKIPQETSHTYCPPCFGHYWGTTVQAV